MAHHYFHTLIAVAEDCPATRGTPPVMRGGKPTVATLQYEMLANSPFQFTQQDVLFETWLRRQPDAQDYDQSELARLRNQLFAKPQACLRASPLPKQYGFGLLFNAHGTIKLLPMESAEYRRIAAETQQGITVVKAMRTKRA